MSQLFDTSPVEDQDSTKRRPSKRATSDEPAAVVEPQAARTFRPAVILGKFDDRVVCGRCEASAHDIVEERGMEWQIECCFCGQLEWVPAVAGHLKPREAEFVFRDGRFAGKTIEEAAAEPRGLDYITWAAKEHKRPSVREACEKHLLTSGAACG